MSSYGVKTQKELSETTDIPTNTISNWVQRGNVPGNIVLKCALDTGADAGWLMTGEFANANVAPPKTPLKGKALYEQILSSGGKAVLRRMLDAYGFSTQKELGDLLGIAPGTISTWIRRDFFPGDVVVTCALDTGVSLAWLATGKGSPRSEAESVDITDETICLMPRYVLKTGKLHPAGEWKIDAQFIPQGVHAPQWVEGSAACWLVDTDVTSISNGRWLLDIDGKNDIYDVALLPGRRMQVDGGGLQFQCGVEEVTPRGVVVLTLTPSL
ncbi:helix-turn-helix domain-containing protein [Dickeya lacustris]|uniref:Helix-turn-helix domain-containing protein n=1 Tax=Dickeya lacustris TaxID=2259638 RepID=A0ABY8G8R8_9GAMM|nr:helix-turn-helix domain-containing protein [Dickeya lacustris]WFN56360.1 helix-turn-helix domain-containing protein [Dickeya lacustris]